MVIPIIGVGRWIWASGQAEYRKGNHTTLSTCQVITVGYLDTWRYWLGGRKLLEPEWKRINPLNYAASIYLQVMNILEASFHHNTQLAPLDQALIVVYLNSEVVPWWNFMPSFLWGVYLHRHGPQHHDKSVTPCHDVSMLCSGVKWYSGLCDMLSDQIMDFAGCVMVISPQPTLYAQALSIQRNGKQRRLFVCSSWMSTQHFGRPIHSRICNLFLQSRPSQPKHIPSRTFQTSGKFLACLARLNVLRISD